MITREEWGALPPIKEPESFEITPLPYLIMSESSTPNCFSKDECYKSLCRIQCINIKLGALDIPHHFYIGGDGLIYEGRGWEVHGNIAFSYDDKSLGISLIGSFDSSTPTDTQINATIFLIEYAKTHNKLRDDFKLRGLRQINNMSRIPRDNFYNIIKTWDHWECEESIKGDCSSAETDVGTSINLL
ncbi:hypothetical protein QAD02_023214 [Eretmocerus hayati]|uniref:Uncharacterized protein n=1 Tax=Eretmocerus hayati TaxID=131215 RepID=A0ACC2Q041_9HYME|nr:hypothetical protein QAD02_023214 [Eretmocerus hayati]